MAAIKKSQSNRSEDQLMEARKIARKSTRLTKKKSKVIGEIKGGSCEGLLLKSERDTANEVRCFANDNRETEEMVQWEMCAGWFIWNV